MYRSLEGADITRHPTRPAGRDVNPNSVPDAGMQEYRQGKESRQVIALGDDTQVAGEGKKDGSIYIENGPGPELPYLFASCSEKSSCG